MAIDSGDIVNEAAPPPTAEERKEGRGSALWREIKGIFWVILAVLAFHSFIAKPFYIPSESMMPVLLKGDRLVVTKYPYGWSYVSPTIPNPAAIFRTMILRGPPEPWGITLPPVRAGCSAACPSAATSSSSRRPARTRTISSGSSALPGDTVELRGGRLVINGAPIRYQVARMR